MPEREGSFAIVIGKTVWPGRLFLQGVLCLLVILSGLGEWAQARSQQNEIIRIQGVSYQPQTRRIVLHSQDQARFPETYQPILLADRMMVDIPNAILSTHDRVVAVQQDGINRIELSHSVGVFYQVTRLTVVVDQPGLLSKLHLIPDRNTLAVAFGDSAGAPSPKVPAPVPASLAQTMVHTSPPPEKSFFANRNVLTGASYEDGTVRLRASEGSKLVIKNQFTLTGPNRLVVDFANTVLANKQLSVPMDFRSGPIRSVRLGQFDEDTVRVVVETPQPNRFYLTYPHADKSQMVLSTYLNRSVRTLPLEDQRVGTIQDINLIKKDEESIIQITTTEPMVRRMIRRGNVIEVDLINMTAKPSIVTYDRERFADIAEIRLSPLNAQEPNTKVLIQLADRALDMDSQLGVDGRSLNIIVSPKAQPTYRHAKMPQVILPGEPLAPVPNVKPGAFTVVVDAGHGGKDKGANREGIYEKDLNLQVAMKLKHALEAKGITVHMTRTTDVFLELSQITAITNRIRPDAFVSVHTNASVNPGLDGLETYYFTPQSRPLAHRVHRRLVNSIGSPDRGVRRARFYVVHHTSVPAILCEMGYISNPAEREALQSESRQQATAEGIAQGVVEFLARSLQADLPEPLAPEPTFKYRRAPD